MCFLLFFFLIPIFFWPHRGLRFCIRCAFICCFSCLLCSFRRVRLGEQVCFGRLLRHRRQRLGTDREKKNRWGKLNWRSKRKSGSCVCCAAALIWTFWCAFVFDRSMRAFMSSSCRWCLRGCRGEPEMHQNLKGVKCDLFWYFWCFLRERHSLDNAQRGVVMVGYLMGLERRERGGFPFLSLCTQWRGERK